MASPSQLRVAPRIGRAWPENRTKLFAVLLIAGGTGLRLASYGQNRSLWVDEALLSLNIVNQPLSTLFRAVPVNDQVAPPGFLVSEKAMVTLMGPTEWSLRLIPLLAGIAGIILFWYLAKRTLRPAGALMALALFVLCEPLVRYSSEAKPYEVDALLTTVILLTFIKVVDTKFQWRAVATCVAVAVTVPWFSYPSMLVLGGCGIALLTIALQEGKGLAALVLVGCAGLISVAVLYGLAMRPAMTHRGLAEYWSGSYPPPPVSFSAFRWYYGAVRTLFEYGFGTIYGAALLACVVGITSLYMSQRRLLWAMLATVALTLAVCGLRFYPFFNRLLLFLFPPLVLLVAGGFAAVAEGSAPRGMVTALAVLLTVDPLLHAFYNFSDLHLGEEIRPVMSWLRGHRRNGDLIYVVDSTKYAFTFYRERFRFSDPDILLGRCAFERPEVCGDFERVRMYQRVWVLYSRGDPKTTELIRSGFSQWGREDANFRAGRAAVWLFEKGPASS